MTEDLLFINPSNRAKEIARDVQEHYGELVKERTGLAPSPYFPAAKMAWLLRNACGRRADKERIFDAGTERSVRHESGSGGNRRTVSMIMG